MRLENIGFYTLSDKRARQSSATSRLMRCEMLLTGRCNFRCPYCRSVGGPDIDFNEAAETIRLWAADELFAIRFSGGEPLLYPRIIELVKLAKESGIEHIAISSNGSMPWAKYEALTEAGVNDWSISLDACCAEDGDRMAGGVKGAWERVISTIRQLSTKTYVTVGIVLTEHNVFTITKTIELAASLGVADIRVIPAAQEGSTLPAIVLSHVILSKYPILAYRIGNINYRTVRGLLDDDSRRCGLVLDDMAVMGDQHYPCIIYLREGGAAIGNVGPNMRQERMDWYRTHDTHQDPICRKNCLDVCQDYNNRFEETNAAANGVESIRLVRVAGGVSDTSFPIIG